MGHREVGSSWQLDSLPTPRRPFAAASRGTLSPVHSVRLFYETLLKESHAVRDPPGLNEQWSDEISALLSQWGEVSLCYSWLHNYSQRKYKRKYHHMSIPIIVLSTLTGTANFADSYVPDSFKQGFSACVGGLNIFCGILGTLMSFLKYAEVYEAHRIAAVAWSSLGRNIEIELALKEERRIVSSTKRLVHDENWLQSTCW